MHKQSILEKTSDKSFTIGFFALVTLELVAGFLFWSGTGASGAFWPIGTVLVFGGLLLLGIGYKMNGKRSHLITMAGWIVFAAYWAMQPMELYVIEGGDIVNMLFCIIGVYVLMYLAYQEFGLYYTESENGNLRWMAGATFIIGWVYFVIDKIPTIASALIYGVAQQTVWLLNLFGLPAFIGPGQTISSVSHGCHIFYDGVDFPITIVLACTGIQSMAIFIGAIACLHAGKSTKDKKMSLHKRKWIGFLATVPVIYILNIVRNVSIIWMVCGLKWDFGLAHNAIGKGGALLALIVIAFVIFNVLPELYDTIYGLFALPRENGPIERTLGSYKGQKRN